MDLTVLFFTAFLVGLSGAVMPGPVTAVAAEHTLKKGIIAAPLITFGHGLIEVLVIILLVFGLGRFMAEPGVAGIIGVAGGIVLAWMGLNMIKSARGGALTLNRTNAHEKTTVGPVMAGMLSSLANPYLVIWWATVGAGYVALSQEHGLPGLLLFYGGHILADFSWLLFIGALLVTGKRFISDRIYSGIVAVLGVFIVGLAAYFFWMGLSWLG